MSRDGASESDRRRDDDVATLVDPDPERGVAFLRDRVGEGAYVTAFGACSVEYEGRASSTLPLGRRHLSLKPDGTALAHDADGNQPVNWQPPGGSVSADLEGETVVVRASRTNPDEDLVVHFDDLVQVSAFEIGGSSRPDTVGTEADLKRYVLEHPDAVEPGLQPLATERETSAGPVDVYAEDRDGRPVVVELKRTRVGPDAVGQLSRYVSALERDLHAGAEPRGVLVAPSVTDRARQLLAEEGLEFSSVDPPTPE